MPKIKDYDFDSDIFDDFISPTNDKSKKKKKKKKGEKKKKDKGKKKKKNKKNKKKNNKNKGYVGDAMSTANSLCLYKNNKSFINKLLDRFNVNIDVESRVGLSIKDETILTAINVGANLLRTYLEKRITK